jgi:hypothetical protein
MSPVPNAEAARCPECGATLSGASECWLCRRATQAGDSSPTSPFAEERKSAGQFSLATVFLIITLIAVCLGSLRLAPGLGVLLIIVATPALIRTCVVGIREKQAGHVLSLGEKVVAFLASSAIIVLVGVAGFIAFQIACWGSCAMVAGIQQKEGENAFLVGLGTGGIAGIGTIIWLVWKTWPRKKS